MNNKADMVENCNMNIKLYQKCVSRAYLYTATAANKDVTAKWRYDSLRTHSSQFLRDGKLGGLCSKLCNLFCSRDKHINGLSMRSCN